jgi:DNA-binding winged helix-turn-helix (wHTH) protein
MTEHKCFVFTFADVEVREREFCIVKAGQVSPVEPKAFRVLLFLLRSPHRLIAKDELLDAVWNDCAVSDNSLTRSIALLRRLLGDDTREPRYIATVPTVGYRFLCDVKVAEDGVIGLGAAETSLPAVEAGVSAETGKHGDHSSLPNAASAEPTRPAAKPAALYAPFPVRIRQSASAIRPASQRRPARACRFGSPPSGQRSSRPSSSPLSAWEWSVGGLDFWTARRNPKSNPLRCYHLRTFPAIPRRSTSRTV